MQTNLFPMQSNSISSYSCVLDHLCGYLHVLGHALTAIIDAAERRAVHRAKPPQTNYYPPACGKSRHRAPLDYRVGI